jgi:hypothetical protein
MQRESNLGLFDGSPACGNHARSSEAPFRKGKATNIDMRVNILIWVIHGPVEHCDCNFFRVRSGHLSHTKEVGGHTTWLTRLRTVIVRIVVQVVCHLEKTLKANLLGVKVDKVLYTAMVTMVADVFQGQRRLNGQLSL